MRAEQAARRLNCSLYAQAEVAGSRRVSLDPDHCKYAITANEVAST